MPRSIKETDGGGDPSSGDEDGVPVDPPTLPPLYVPVDVVELAWSAQMPVLVRAPRNPRTRTGRSPY
jgi:hypothetical protein